MAKKSALGKILNVVPQLTAQRGADIQSLANQVSGLNADGTPDTSSYVDSGPDQSSVDAYNAAVANVNSQYGQSMSAIDAAAKELADRAATLSKQTADQNAAFQQQASADTQRVMANYATATQGVQNPNAGSLFQPTMTAHDANANTFMAALNATAQNADATRLANSAIVTAGAKNALELAKFQALASLAASMQGGGGGGGGGYGGGGGGSKSSSSGGGALPAGIGGLLGDLVKYRSMAPDAFRINALTALKPDVRKFVVSVAKQQKGKNPILNNAGTIAQRVEDKYGSKVANYVEKRILAQRNAKIAKQQAVTKIKADLAAQGYSVPPPQRQAPRKKAGKKK